MTYDFKCMSHDSHRHELLAIVSPVHHERVGQSLDDGALSLAKTLDGISACRVRDVDGRADLNVITVHDR